MVEGLSEGSYRMIRLKMSWSSSVYRSFIFDQNNVYRLDFDPQERLTAIVRYRKVNEWLINLGSGTQFRMLHLDWNSGQN